MNMDLVTPCKTCPFKVGTDFPLRLGRVHEILAAICDRDMTFACHATVDYDDEPDPDSDHCVHDIAPASACRQCIPGQLPRISKPGEQHCAGAMILLTHIRRPNQWMRIAQRIRLFDPSRLKMDAPVFKTRAQMLAHFRKMNRATQGR